MKPRKIRFFAPEENAPKPRHHPAPDRPVIGHVSASGKILFPLRILLKLGIEPVNIRFKVGIDRGKRKITRLYLVPTNDENAFRMVRVGRVYSLPLGTILLQGGIDYAARRYRYIVSIFNYENVTAFALDIALEPAANEISTDQPQRKRRKMVYRLDANRY